jgi:hypothetical protein
VIRNLAPLASALALLVGCGGGPAAPLTPPFALCGPASPAGSCREPAEVERMLIDPELEILGSDDPPSGAQGTRVLTVASSATGSRVVFRAKWRPWSTELGFNSPRKDVAAYAVQSMLLAPHDHVVPPTRAACLDLDRVRRGIDEDASATWPPARCSAGILAYWLEGSLSLEAAHDEGWLREEYPLDGKLFDASEPYRRSVADINLLAHLISHGDSHWQQFLVTGDPRSPRMYLVDNSIAFSSYRNSTFKNGKWDWSNIHVPRLRRASLDRMREMSDAELDRLMVVEHLRREGDRLVPGAMPGGEAGKDRDHGVRRVGDDVQIGLDEAEITALRRRIRKLIAKVDAGQIVTF